MKQLCLVPTVLLVASAIASAHAASVEGPAGTLTLPDGITVTVAPGEPVVHGGQPSTVFTLTGDTSGAVPVTLSMSCIPAVGKLEPYGFGTDLKRLVSASYSVNKTLKRKRGVELVQVDALPAYRSQGVHDNGTQLTQWALPLVTAFAWIEFNRPPGAPLEQTVLNAVERMTVLCGPMAPRKAQDA